MDTNTPNQGAALLLRLLTEVSGKLETFNKDFKSTSGVADSVSAYAKTLVNHSEGINSSAAALRRTIESLEAKLGNIADKDLKAELSQDAKDRLEKIEKKIETFGSGFSLRRVVLYPLLFSVACLAYAGWTQKRNNELSRDADMYYRSRGQTIVDAGRDQKRFNEIVLLLEFFKISPKTQKNYEAFRKQRIEQDKMGETFKDLTEVANAPAK